MTRLDLTRVAAADLIGMFRELETQIHDPLACQFEVECLLALAHEITAEMQRRLDAGHTDPTEALRWN